MKLTCHQVCRSSFAGYLAKAIVSVIVTPKTVRVTLAFPDLSKDGVFHDAILMRDKWELYEMLQQHFTTWGVLHHRKVGEAELHIGTVRTLYERRLIEYHGEVPRVGSWMAGSWNNYDTFLMTQPCRLSPYGIKLLHAFTTALQEEKK